VGIDVTGQGVKFLLEIDGAAALKSMRQFQSGMQTMAKGIETVVEQTQQGFTRILDNMEKVIRQTERAPGIVFPFGAGPKSAEAQRRLRADMEKLRQETEKGFKTMKQGINDITNGADTLTNSLGDTNKGVRDLGDNLDAVAMMGPRLKALAGQLGISLGIGAIASRSVELSNSLESMAARLGDATKGSRELKQELISTSEKSDGFTSNIQTMMESLVQLGVTSGSTRKRIMEDVEKFSNIFKTERGPLIQYFAEMTTRGMMAEDQIASVSSALTQLQNAKYGPGTVDQDIDAMRKSTDAFRLIDRQRKDMGMGDKERQQLMQYGQLQMAGLGRVGRKAGLDESNLQNVFTQIPSMMGTGEGNRFVGALGSLSGRGSQEFIDEIIKTGRFDKIGKALEDAAEKFPDKLSAILTPDVVSTMTGGVLSNPKDLIFALKDAKEKGIGLADAMKQVADDTAKAYQEQKALNEQWDKFKQTLGGKWNEFGSTWDRILTKLTIILEGPLTSMLDWATTISKKFEELIDYVNSWGAGLAFVQGVIKGIGALFMARGAIGAIKVMGASIMGLGTAFQFLLNPIAGVTAALTAFFSKLGLVSKVKDAAVEVANATKSAASGGVAGAEAAAAAGSAARAATGGAGAAGAAGVAEAAAGAAKAARPGVMVLAPEAVTGLGQGSVDAALGAERAAKAATLANAPGMGAKAISEAATLAQAPAAGAKGISEAAESMGKLGRAATTGKWMVGQGLGKLGEGMTKTLNKLSGPLAFIGAGLSGMGAAEVARQETGSEKQAWGAGIGNAAGTLAGGWAGRAAGLWAATKLGAMAGGALGAAGGGIGAVPGALIGGALGLGGAVVGSIYGGKAAGAAGQWIGSFFDKNPPKKIGDDIGAGMESAADYTARKIKEANAQGADSAEAAAKAVKEAGESVGWEIRTAAEVAAKKTSETAKKNAEALGRAAGQAIEDRRKALEDAAVRTAAKLQEVLKKPIEDFAIDKEGYTKQERNMLDMGIKSGNTDMMANAADYKALREAGMAELQQKILEGVKPQDLKSLDVKWKNQGGEEKTSTLTQSAIAEVFKYIVAEKRGIGIPEKDQGVNATKNENTGKSWAQQLSGFLDPLQVAYGKKEPPRQADAQKVEVGRPNEAGERTPQQQTMAPVQGEVGRKTPLELAKEHAKSTSSEDLVRTVTEMFSGKKAIKVDAPQDQVVGAVNQLRETLLNEMRMARQAADPGGPLSGLFDAYKARGF